MKRFTRSRTEWKCDQSSLEPGLGCVVTVVLSFCTCSANRVQAEPVLVGPSWGTDRSVKKLDAEWDVSVLRSS